MITKIDKNEKRKKIHMRTRKAIVGTPDRLRLCVYRSLNHIYAQIIDDSITENMTGKTLVSCSTVEKDVVAAVAKMTKTDAAKYVGEQVAKKAIAAGIEDVVFDRGGYIYTGRVQALAEGARAAGLKF